LSLVSDPHSEAMKWRNDIWGWEMAVSVCICIACWVGTGISMGGISQLPKCKYGDARCYFFVKICDADLMSGGSNQPACFYVAKRRKTEGGTENGLEQVAIPFMSSAMGLIPGPILVIAMAMRNERCLFGMLDYGKMFILFNLVTMVMSVQQMNKLTWDCRWYDEEYHPDQWKCGGAYDKYLLGTCFLFAGELTLLIGLVIYSEIEKKRVNQDRTWMSEAPQIQSNAVQMSARPMAAPATEVPIQQAMPSESKASVGASAW